MLNTLSASGASDPLSGTLTIQEGTDAKATTSTYNLAGQTIDEIVAAFTTGPKQTSESPLQKMWPKLR